MKDIETTVRNLYHIIVRGDTIFVYPLEYGDRLDAGSLYKIEYPDKDYDYEWEAKYFVKWVPKDECEVTYYDVIKNMYDKKDIRIFVDGEYKTYLSSLKHKDFYDEEDEL